MRQAVFNHEVANIFVTIVMPYVIHISNLYPSGVMRCGLKTLGDASKSHADGRAVA
jgi:hypothetical protein